MDLGTAPRLSFTRCPPSFLRLRQAMVSPLLRPLRRSVAPARLTIPPLPPRAVRPTLALRFRAALLSATGFGAANLGSQRL